MNKLITDKIQIESLKSIENDTELNIVSKNGGKYIELAVTCNNIDTLPDTITKFSLSDGKTVIQKDINYNEIVSFCKDVYLSYIKFKGEMITSKIKQEELEKLFREVYDEE